MISEDKALENANELHPELKNWGPKEYHRAEIRDGVNWQMHLQMDAVVLRRESDPALPDSAVIQKLRQKGVSYLDAVHRISRLVTEDLWERMKGPPKAPGQREASEQEFDEWAAEKNRILDQKIQELAEV